MKPRYFLIGTVLVFAVGVGLLLNFGQPFLSQLGMADTTVCYLDLARQAVERQDYVQANEMYKQALIYARKNDPSGQAEGAMLLTYGKFAVEKKHDPQLFTQLQQRAAVLRKLAQARAANL
jgi:hypothetical protein